MSQQNKLKPFFYGLAELGPASIDIFLKVYLLLFFNVILGLSPTLTSLAIGLGVLWDALLDPWIGIFSDRYYHKKGHRKGVIYSAILISVFLFYVMWRIPHYSQLSTFLLLFLVSSLLNSAISLFSVPYIAIANDLEKDNLKRTVWTGWRLAFFNFGSFVGLSVPAFFLTTAAKLDSSGASAAPYEKSTLVLIAIMLVSSIFSIYYVYRNTEATENSTELVAHAKFSHLVKDKKFLRMMTSFFVVNCGLGLNSALALYYYKNYLEFTESQTQIILVGFLLVFTLSIPLWIYLIRFFDKRKLIIVAAFLLGLLTVLSFPNYKGVDFWLIASIASGVGGVLVGVAVVLEIYLSDFIKEKELETQQNVSGQYLGVWKMSSKISRAVAIALAGPILEVATDTKILANYFGWGVGLFFILAAVVMALPIKSDLKD
ncbi:MFS transporter [bacterium]|nr:MFS transporter [bacterium]